MVPWFGADAEDPRIARTPAGGDALNHRRGVGGVRERVPGRRERGHKNSPFGNPHLPQRLQKVRIKHMVGQITQVVPVKEQRTSLCNCSAGVLRAKYRERVPYNQLRMYR